MFQVPTPPGRIIALAVPAGGRRIKDRFDPGPDPARCFGLGRPYRLQDLPHHGDIDILNRQGAEDGKDVGGKGVVPLGGVLRVAPSGLVQLDVALGGGLEGDRPGGFQAGLGSLRVPRLDGVDAVGAQRSRLSGLRPRSRKRDREGVMRNSLNKGTAAGRLFGSIAILAIAGVILWPGIMMAYNTVVFPGYETCKRGISSEMPDFPREPDWSRWESLGSVEINGVPE